MPQLIVIVFGLAFAALARAEAPNPIVALGAKIDSGEVELIHRPGQGYLLSLLEAFGIPRSSQTLVFSKTSAQFRLINRLSPRALYFNDDVYVGWVRGGPFLEVSAADPGGGGVFYTLSQQPRERPRFIRDNGQCLQCHESSRTQRIPGHLTRSVYPDPSGLPNFRFGTIDVDQTTALPQRFGGWFVTGRAAGLSHRGNAFLAGEGDLERFEQGLAAPEGGLADWLDIDAYPEATSDIVAHLLLAHQTQTHNRISLAGLETRKALSYRDEMIARFGEPSAELLASVRRRIEGPSEKLVRFLLFADEAPLAGPVTGDSEFAEQFQQRGPFDSQGRSLRQLDLKTRLLRYPLSYLIYSEAFDGLPREVLAFVSRRLDDILSAEKPEPGFERFTAADRRAIREILDATKPGLLP